MRTIPEELNADIQIAKAMAQPLLSFLRARKSALLKAPLIGIMVWFAVATASGHFFKGAFVGVICVLLAMFTTWRRLLEPISFFAFGLAVLYWCDIDLVQQVRIAMIGVVR